MANVSKENLRKVERFFVESTKAHGTNRTEATVIEIADGSGVALATAHKALKELDQRGLLTIIKPSSRRFPITYIYTGDIEGFSNTESKEEQIEYLQDLLTARDQKIIELEAQIKKLTNKDNVLQNV
jgi:DNA-binding MarR family transcriptional regulator